MIHDDHGTRARSRSQDGGDVTAGRHNGQGGGYVELPTAYHARVAREFAARTFGRAVRIIGDPLPFGFSTTPEWRR